MRQIEFRGKCLETGEWVEGSFVRCDDVDTHDLILSCKGAFRYKIIPETVGQFTRLFYKNGVKIFEWDVVAEKDYDKGSVVFDGASFCINWIYRRYLTRYLNYHINKYQNNLEVIGNIHDQPELLKEAAQ